MLILNILKLFFPKQCRASSHTLEPPGEALACPTGAVSGPGTLREEEQEGEQHCEQCAVNSSSSASVAEEFNVSCDLKLCQFGQSHSLISYFGV